MNRNAQEGVDKQASISKYKIDHLDMNLTFINKMRRRISVMVKVSEMTGRMKGRLLSNLPFVSHTMIVTIECVVNISLKDDLSQ